MKTIVWFGAVVVLIVVGFYTLNGYLYNQKQEDAMDTLQKTSGPEIIPISHATAIIQWGDAAIYLDPVGGEAAFAGKQSANIVLVTDIHGDHFSTSTLSSIVHAGVELIVPHVIKDALPTELATRARVMNNGEKISVQGFSIEAIPMYNLPDAENADRHTKGRGNGYIIEKDGFRVYIAGDTAGTPEMRALKEIDIALVPMNLPYTMGVDEAADAVLSFKPKVVYPYHYRSPDGLADVERFKILVQRGDADITVILAPWYPAQ